MIVVILSSLAHGTTAAFASTVLGENDFSQAAVMVQQEQYTLAEPLLKQAIQISGAYSLLGENAAYMLMGVYGCEGRYEDALQESITLLRLLKHSQKRSVKSPSSTLHSSNSRSGQTQRGGVSADAPISSDISFDEILAQQQVFQAALQKESQIKSHLASIQDPAAILALHGTLDDNRLRSQEAMREYRAAYRLLSHEPQATSEAHLLVEEPFLMRLTRIDGLKPGEGEQIAMLYGNRILADPAASPSQQRLALSLLDSMILEPSLQSNLPDSPQVLTLKKSLDALAAVPIRSESADVHRWVNDLRRRLTEHDVNLMLDAAVEVEKSGDWASASEAYQAVIQRADAINDLAEQSESIDRMEAQAKRSLPLMRSLYHLSAGAGTVSQNSALQNASLQDNSIQKIFLGIDHTVGGDWRGVLGTEAWTLFAVHGDDLCGGPRLLDGLFSYHIRGGDPANEPRRWRDPAGYKTAPGDLALVDPAVSGERVLSFLDDNGENYASGAGPDLYLDLTIPAGHHLLSIPLHFSYPENQAATYGLYLLTSNSTAASSIDNSTGVSSLNSSDSSSGSLRCLDYSFVSMKDAPGYVRLAVRGPAHYTLLVRRLTGYNTNIPAVFLDPDPRWAKPLPLSYDLSAEDFAAIGLPPDADATENVPAENDVDRLRRVAHQYTRIADQYPSQHANTPAASDTTVEDSSWSDIEAQASPLADDHALRPAQRLVAALITWRARQRLPLQVGRIAAAFAQYIARRYGDSSPEPGDQQAAILNGRPDAVPNLEAGPDLEALHTLANQLRTSGSIRLAEIVQDAAWSIQVPPKKSPDRSTVEALNRPVPAELTAQDALVKSLLDTEIRPYLEPQTLWLWRGTGGPEPTIIHIALDCNYASRHVAVLARGLVTSDFSLRSQRPPQTMSTAVSSAKTLTPLRPSAPVSPISFNDLPAQRARIWVNQLGQEWGASINGLPVNPWEARPADGRDAGGRDAGSAAPLPQGNVLNQPIGNILYVSACQPLLGEAGSRLELPANSPDLPEPADISEPPTTRACLLQPDQLETLSHAWLDLNLFPTSSQSTEQRQASRLLKTIQVRFPDYPRLSQVEDFLAHLPSDN